MKPGIGSVVHYVARGSADAVYPQACRAAIVTALSPHPDGRDVVAVAVLNPTGMFFGPDCEHDPGRDHDEELTVADGLPAVPAALCTGRAHRGGTWHWPAHADHP